MTMKLPSPPLRAGLSVLRNMQGIRTSIAQPMRAGIQMEHR